MIMTQSFTENRWGLSRPLNEYSSKGIIPFPYGVGIEIELEFDNVPRIEQDMTYWNIVPDGSLKNGMEFVVKEPLYSNSIPTALKELNSMLKKHSKSKVRLSERTSLHIHVDARDMSREQISNFVMVYTAFESVLFKYCGEERKNNVFCISPTTSATLINTLGSFILGGDTRAGNVVRRYSKYTSINLATLSKYGSIEIRGHEGTHNSAQIITWINILLSIKQYVLNNTTATWLDLPERLSNRGLKIFLTDVFGKYAKYLDHKDVEDDILKGVRVVQDAINSDKYEKISRDTYTGDTDFLRKESPPSKIFLKYVAEKYPKVYASKFAVDAKKPPTLDLTKTVINRSVVGKGSTYTVSEGYTITTNSGKQYPLFVEPARKTVDVENMREYLYSDAFNIFFVNIAGTKVIIDNGSKRVLAEEFRREQLKFTCVDPIRKFYLIEYTRANEMNKLHNTYQSGVVGYTGDMVAPMQVLTDDIAEEMREVANAMGGGVDLLIPADQGDIERQRHRARQGLNALFPTPTPIDD